MPRVLIIDDDADMVEALKIVLEKKGYSVDFAYEGEAGYNKAAAERPDLIILDVMMKTKDQGFQISYKLKGNPELSRIPIIMLTAVGKETGYRFSHADEDYLPADEFVEKPVKPAYLLKLAGELIRKSGRESGTSRI
ncbi:MAG: response regulator [Deltaproteobacteria bacterium]|nr:response regulator [Deltaproteobacteria bacterium]